MYQLDDDHKDDSFSVESAICLGRWVGTLGAILAEVVNALFVNAHKKIYLKVINIV